MLGHEEDFVESSIVFDCAGNNMTIFNIHISSLPLAQNLIHYISLGLLLFL